MKKIETIKELYEKLRMMDAKVKVVFNRNGWKITISNRRRPYRRMTVVSKGVSEAIEKGFEEYESSDPPN